MTTFSTSPWWCDLALPPPPGLCYRACWRRRARTGWALGMILWVRKGSQQCFWLPLVALLGINCHLIEIECCVFLHFQNEIKQHGFFCSINWDDLLQKKIPPPFTPKVVSIPHYIIVLVNTCCWVFRLSMGFVFLFFNKPVVCFNFSRTPFPISPTSIPSSQMKWSPTRSVGHKNIPSSTPAWWRPTTPLWASLMRHLPTTPSYEARSVCDGLENNN